MFFFNSTPTPTTTLSSPDVEFETNSRTISIDLYLRNVRGSLDGLRVVFIGAAGNIGRSWFEAAARFPIHVVQVYPVGYEVEAEFLKRIAGEAEGEAGVTQQMHSAIVDADVIYTDCWPVRENSEESLRISELFLPYQVTEAVLETCPQDVIFLPCPPVHKGEEVSENAMNWPGCRVYEAKEFLLHAQNALLVSLLNDSESL